MAAPERGWQTLFQHRNIPAGGYSKSYSKVSENGNLEAGGPVGFELVKHPLQTRPRYAPFFHRRWLSLLVLRRSWKV